MAWTLLFGQINFELFGRFEGVVHDTQDVFYLAVTVMAEFLGLRQE